MGAKKPSKGPSIMPIPPNVPVSRPLGDIGVGGGPGVPPRFPTRGRRRRKPLPKGALAGLATPPRGFEFNENNELVPRSGGGRRTPRRGDAPPGFVRGPNDKLIPIKKRGGFGIGGGPGIPPKFPAGDYDDPRMIPINPNRPRYKKGSDRLIPIIGGRKRPTGRRGRRSCPDPNMHILMSDGTQKKAGDLKVGDLIKTNHEKTLELGEYKVEYVNILENVEKIKLIFDESVIICSLTHKFYVDDSWKEAKDMVIGDKVSGKKLLSIENVEDGDVVHITVEDAHTYICEGLLSHNKRMLPTDPRRGGGPRVPISPVDGRPVSDPTLGGPPEREVPIPKERIRPITRESDPRGGAPFGPDERAMARDRFFERMFERADERRQQGSMEREERREVRRARMDERRARRDEPGEIDVGGEIDINAERGGRRRRRRRRRRDFTRRRSGMERRRSREERAAFRDRYVSTMR